MRCICVRLRRGDDLLRSIESIVRRENISAGAVVSAVGCLYEICLRDAGGQAVHHLVEDMEILSVHGTLSPDGCHLHLALSRKDLSALGGHLMPGCLVNTTCELVLLALEETAFSRAFDPQTGYDELTIG